MASPAPALTAPVRPSLFQGFPAVPPGAPRSHSFPHAPGPPTRPTPAPRAASVPRRGAQGAGPRDPRQGPTRPLPEGGAEPRISHPCRCGRAEEPAGLCHVLPSDPLPPRPPARHPRLWDITAEAAQTSRASRAWRGGRASGEGVLDAEREEAARPLRPSHPG